MKLGKKTEVKWSEMGLMQRDMVKIVASNSRFVYPIINRIERELIDFKEMISYDAREAYFKIQ